jgi:hypothetical protein
MATMNKRTGRCELPNMPMLAHQGSNLGPAD